MCCTVVCFAGLDTIAKYLNQHMDTLQVVWSRYIVAFAVAVAISNPFTRPGLLVTRRPVLQVVRSALLLASTVLNFIALRYLQLDEVLAILFSTPFIVAVLAGPMLGEWVGWRRWSAIAVGFVGILVITRPGITAMHFAMLLSLLSAFTYALYLISTRFLAGTDPSDTTLFYSNLVGAAVMSLVVPFVWKTPESALIVVLIVVMGSLGTIGHYLLIIAHRMAPASALSPFNYTQLVWVAMLGFLVFGDVPTGWTLAGAAIVIASGLYLVHRERVVRGER
jgi:drug/metabolite transporter (DMT)-like permease